MSGRYSEQEENQWDRLLKIKTMGRDDSNADQYRYPYEPTPYAVLERLANSGWIRKGDVLLDYGCGKGRVDCYLSYQTRCHSIGVEYDPRIYEAAAENQKTAVSGSRAVPETVNRAYFFNPFSVELLKKVVRRILDSWYENPREIRLFFYYPSDEYMAYLMTVDELMFADEIDCRDLFDGKDVRERIVLFEIA